MQMANENHITFLHLENIQTRLTVSLKGIKIRGCVYFKDLKYTKQKVGLFYSN